MGKAGLGLLLQQHQSYRSLDIQGAGSSHDRCRLTSQFFAILEANYPETVKNLVVIRGEFVAEMTPAWGRKAGVGMTVKKPLGWSCFSKASSGKSKVFVCFSLHSFAD